MSLTILVEGTLTPEHTLTYVHLPFEVPENIGRIDVLYRYDATISSDPTVQGGNTLDIGIFDWRGIGFNSAGYRGWSGSARDRFTVGEHEATPGYMPGPIAPGTWHICLGAYKVAAQGCQYQVEITLTERSSPPSAHFPPLLTLSNQPKARFNPSGWYRGELHCHTINSDGDSTPEEIVRLAESLGLDFLAITDHNNRTQGIDLAQIETPLLLIPGYEVTTYHGHWNVWGDQGWVDFRVQTEADMVRSIEAARDAGYLVSCNHPRPYGPDWAYPDIEGYECVEVWNGPWKLLNDISLAFWEARLRRGERLTAVGGSDHHFTHRGHLARLGHPTMFIHCDGSPSPAVLLRNLHAGHAFISESPDGPKLTLSAYGAMMGDLLPRPTDHQLKVKIQVEGGLQSRLELHGDSGLIKSFPVSSLNEQFVPTLDIADSRYVRAQLVDVTSGEVRALTNPLYLAAGQS